MKNIAVICALIALTSSTPAQRRRDIGIALREDHSETTVAPSNQDVIYGNNIPGHDAQITAQEFKIDDLGNYNFK
jgi:hypothetical protein